MSTAPPKGRRLIHGIDTSGAHPVEYRFTHAKGGNRHLVVVFANFAVTDDYGWSNGVLDPVRANILWIRDRFHGMNSYYLCRDMDFSLEQSVAAVIGKVMTALDLTPDDVTVWGGSKGGSAALYFGLRYGFRNIVSIVPQFLIGTYVRQKHPKVARFMLGEGVPGHNVRALDALLPDLVRSGAGRRANVYLLSSPQDEQYAEQVEPFLGLFQGYENFNFVFSESPYITDHTQVTRRNVPLLMGILNCLADGAAPRFGLVRNGYEQPERDTSAIDAYLSATSQQQGQVAPPIVLAPASGARLPRDGVRFEGTAQGAVRVSLWENGKFLGSPSVAPDGTWSWQLSRAWSKGRHVVKAVAWNADKQHSRGTEVPFVTTEAAVGTEPGTPARPAATGGADDVPAGVTLPAPDVRSPESYEQIPGSAVRFTGLAPGAAQVGFRAGGTLLGTTPVAADGRWTWDSGWSWQEGRHTVEVFAVDTAGTESTAAPVPFAVLNTPAGARPFGH
ncbi:hypothetical protein [Streptomyces poriticola]|uniref:hypothetical protein n=1 Tax=Streptomyces poriticola TaxID=3120506 RepID=UPI002FCE590D